MFTKQQIADLMVTALEGGSNYWLARVLPVYRNYTEYSEPERYGPTMTSRTFSDWEEDCTGVLDWASITKAAQIMHDKYPHHYADVISDNMDADTADVFLQCAVFGEIVFG